MKLYFREFGHGDPLIILHGLYGSSDNWVTIAKGLEKYFRVILVDQRNHGQSPHHHLHNYASMVDDLVELFNDTGIEKSSIIGHSMGGKVAMLFAAKYPENVRSLVIVDIAPWTYKNPSSDYQPWLDDHSRIISSLKSVPISMISQRAEADAILSYTLSSDRIRQFLLKNLYRNKNGSFSWKFNIEALSNNLENIMDGVIMPNELCFSNTLFIRAELSNYIPPNRVAELKSFFPNSIAKTIIGADHWVHAEKPDEFMKSLLEFLNKQ